MLPHQRNETHQQQFYALVVAQLVSEYFVRSEINCHQNGEPERSNVKCAQQTEKEEERDGKKIMRIKVEKKSSRAFSKHTIVQCD